MKELKWKKEVTYLLEYNGDSFEKTHYVNGIDGRRYQSTEDRINDMVPGLTTLKSTGNDFQVIKAELVASRDINLNGVESTELIYHFPDIDFYFHCSYRQGNFSYSYLHY
ncbi:hypothetical protein [Shouchella patagoniensis]|uniref:hypothetical protein n=1 Tax=Shouchella patagoniensis TaxID=228576 RepID=UPI0009952CFE|nr:hypothetical protein [Shouchella patagoniensis]